MSGFPVHSWEPTSLRLCTRCPLLCKNTNRLHDSFPKKARTPVLIAHLRANAHHWFLDWVGIAGLICDPGTRWWINSSASQQVNGRINFPVLYSFCTLSKYAHRYHPVIMNYVYYTIHKMARVGPAGPTHALARTIHCRKLRRAQLKEWSPPPHQAGWGPTDRRLPAGIHPQQPGGRRPAVGPHPRPNAGVGLEAKCL